jgi:hypothetical protein
MKNIDKKWEDKMKTDYEKPEIEITVFETENILNSSSRYDNDGRYNDQWQ